MSDDIDASEKLDTSRWVYSKIEAHAVRAGKIRGTDPDPLFTWMLEEHQATSDRIQHELDLEEVARLTPEQRADVARWAEHHHYDTHHGPNRWPGGIYSCHLYPTDPRETP